jgi:hypothetical protein
LSVGWIKKCLGCKWSRPLGVSVRVPQKPLDRDDSKLMNGLIIP